MSLLYDKRPVKKLSTRNSKRAFEITGTTLEIIRHAVEETGSTLDIILDGAAFEKKGRTLENKRSSAQYKRK